MFYVVYFLLVKQCFDQMDTFIFCCKILATMLNTIVLSVITMRLCPEAANLYKVISHQLIIRLAQKRKVCMGA